MQLGKAFFMLRKLLWDLSNKGKFVGISDDLTGEKLGDYYLLFTEDLAKLNALIIGYDENGIPLNRGYIDVEKAAPHYYPISIGQVALAIYNTYSRTGASDKRTHFLKIADWFVEQTNTSPDLGAYWLTDVPKPEYQVTKPWKSAFTQSRAISVLMRAWQLTKSETYLNLATEALMPFEKDISDGGVAIRRDGVPIFYEEYVAEQPTRVLDGHAFALFGLFDFVRATSFSEHLESNQQAQRLFDEGIEGLVESLPTFDLGYWARFNHCEIENYPTWDPCTLTYLQLVITQLEILFRISNHKVLRQYQEKFRQYLKWGNIARMYYEKFRSLKNLNRI